MRQLTSRIQYFVRVANCWIGPTGLICRENCSICALCLKFRHLYKVAAAHLLIVPTSKPFLHRESHIENIAAKRRLIIKSLERVGGCGWFLSKSTPESDFSIRIWILPDINWMLTNLLWTKINREVLHLYKRFQHKKGWKYVKFSSVVSVPKSQNSDPIKKVRTLPDLLHYS
jgi:hypothetical protein